MESGGTPLPMIIFYLVVMVAMIAGMWKVFEKAGKPGWAAIIPIYNLIVLLEVIDRPMWWILLILCTGPIGGIMVAMDMAENFGKSKGWGIGMLFLIPFVGYPMLGFGDAQYTKISRQ